MSIFGFFNVFFKLFDFFFKNYPLKREFLSSIDITGCNILFCMGVYAQFFYTTSKSSRKIQFFDILTVFWKLLTSLENYPSNSKVKCSNEKPDFGNFLCLSGHDILFAEFFIDFWKSNFWTFDRFLNFLRNKPIRSEIKDAFERTCCESFSHRSGNFLIFLQNVIFVEIPISQKFSSTSLILRFWSMSNFWKFSNY